LRTTDAFVGEAFTYLRKQGELENTYVFFYTDNGNHWGEHRLDEGKMTPLRDGYKLPHPCARPRGAQGPGGLPEAGGHHDLAPTFAQIGAAQTPSFVDGTSFPRLLDQRTSNDLPWRKALFVQREWRKGWTVPKKAYPYYVPPYEAVRQADSTYVRYADNPWTTERDGFPRVLRPAQGPLRTEERNFLRHGVRAAAKQGKGVAR
jgi:arylsulfatase A-like enzyme